MGPPEPLQELTGHRHHHVLPDRVAPVAIKGGHELFGGGALVDVGVDAYLGEGFEVTGCSNRVSTTSFEPGEA